MVYVAYFTELNLQFAITHKNNALVTKIVNMRLTKIFQAIFAPDERLPSFATLLTIWMRVAEVGGLLASAKMPIRKIGQARICYYRDKCVVFARNCKFAISIQYDMQYIPCNNALLAKETLLLSLNSTVLPKSSEMCIKHDKS